MQKQKKAQKRGVLLTEVVHRGHLSSADGRSRGRTWGPKIGLWEAFCVPHFFEHFEDKQGGMEHLLHGSALQHPVPVVSPPLLDLQCETPSHGGAVSSLLYATPPPPPVGVGRRPLGGGGGHWRGGVQGGAMGGGGSGRGDGGGGSGRGDGGGVGRVGWGGVQVGQFGVVGGGSIGSRYLPLPSLMGES